MHIVNDLIFHGNHINENHALCIRYPKSSRSASINRLFLWALGLLCILRLRLAVILSLSDTAFLLHLCDIQVADL